MIFILYPHQLFQNIESLRDKKVLLIEEPLFFTQYRFHIQKLILHRASMKFYAHYLVQNAIDVEYYEDESYLDIYKEQEVCVYDLVDDYLMQKISKNFSRLRTLKNPNFIDSEDETHFFHSYYKNRRLELGILLEEGNKPVGGKWSFDALNRKKIPKGLALPFDLAFDNSYIDEAKEYVKKFETLGSVEEFYYPTTFAEAKMAFEHFLRYKFRDFGTYQDAIVEEQSFLFHSNISSSLNCGLLSLEYVIERTLAVEDVPLNAKEGFLRQIIGWREYMLHIYKRHGVRVRNANYFDAKNPMPKAILEAKSGITPLDETIKKLDKTAYAHHIERLMVLGNIFLLLEIQPEAVHDFFMRYFIDAYDWVMVGNVYVMSLYADGGGFTTKPYMGASNYMLKMSDYKKGPWCEILDALYWSFLDKHKEKLSSNIRMKMQLSLLEKIDEEKLGTHKRVAREFKESLGLYDMMESDENRLIEMAWQDRVPFEIIQKQYGLTENQLKSKMRSLISEKAYKRWRKRVQGRSTKHTKKLYHKPDRFQGPW